jgi:hypothetical protein
MSPKKDGACVVFAGPISFVYDRRDFSFCSTVTTAKTTAKATRWVRGFRSTFSKTSMKNLRCRRPAESWVRRGRTSNAIDGDQGALVDVIELAGHGDIDQ